MLIEDSIELLGRELQMEHSTSVVLGDTGRKQSTWGRDCTGSVNCMSESRGVNTIPDGDGNLITLSSQTPCGL